jgi:hypothetical protein
MKSGQRLHRHAAASFSGTLLIVAILLTVSGCGSGNSSSSGTPSTGQQAATTPMLVNIGDFPSDQVTAFAMTINSITLNGSNGSTTVMSSATPVEMTRLAGTKQPLTLTTVPQGTYNSATINAGSAMVTFMNPGSSTPIQQTVSVGPTTVNFSAPMTLGSAPAVFNFDMDLTRSIGITNGSITMTPTYTASMDAPGSGPQDPEHGVVQIIGSVASTSGSGFGLSMMQSSQSVSFATNASTTFDNMSGMGMMGGGQILSVDAAMQSNGTLLAQKVQLMANSGGVMADGLINTTGTGTFNMFAQNGTGSGMMSSMLANMLTINTSGASYNVDDDGIDMTGLLFNDTSFNVNTISKCQRVQAVSYASMGPGGGMMGGMRAAGTLSASQIRLMQQEFVGVVSAYSAGPPAAFTLMLDPSSAFTTLTGISNMTIHQQAGTELQGLSSISNGATVMVRGLLFQTSPGVFEMVAGRIQAP